jgi:hypothetical protein
MVTIKLLIDCDKYYKQNTAEGGIENGWQVCVSQVCVWYGDLTCKERSR